MIKPADHCASTTEKGNKLEDQFFDYLTDQVEANELVYDAYPPSNCKIRKKPEYFCDDRKANVEFDIVIEVRRTGRDQPHLYVVFECKNHKKPVEDIYVRNFSDQIRSVFGQSAKGIIVTSHRLQSGAEHVATNRRLGIVKFDQTGIDVIADRTVGIWAEDKFIRQQLLTGIRRQKSLRFSGFSDGSYFCTVDQMLRVVEENTIDLVAAQPAQPLDPIPFLPEAQIKHAADETLSLVRYAGGEVELHTLCCKLQIYLEYSDRQFSEAIGQTVLGTANFTRRTIEIYQNRNPNRERFTIAHEVGHFALDHEKYLRAEQTVERDLFAEVDPEAAFNYERLEIQANLFASALLLPDSHFWPAVDEVRQRLGLYDKGFGYIFVDDQPCNDTPYRQILSTLSGQFGASKRAIELKLKRAGLVTDNRNHNRIRP